MVLYHLHTEYTNPVQALSADISPSQTSKPPLETESLWVSRADGQGFREIGYVVVPFIPSDIAEDTENNV